MKTFSIFLLVVAAILIFNQEAGATFVATPMEFYLNVPEGQEITQTFFVRNRGEETISLKVYTGDFWIDPEGKESFLEPGKVERSLAKWIEVSPEELELAPGQSQAIRFKLTMPPESKGSYWGMVFAEQISKPTIKTAQKGQQQFNIIAFQRIGIRIFEDTLKTQPSGGKISQVNVSWDTATESYKVGLKFENEGDMLLKCRTTIEIKNNKGETEKGTQLEQFNCYPKASRIASGYITSALVPGKYTALVIVDYGADTLVAGESIFEVAQGGLFVSAKEPLPETTKKEELKSQEQKKPATEQEKTLVQKFLKALTDLGEIIRYTFISIWKRIARSK